MAAIFSKASGKTILFGEHAVVYGQPAIAVPVDAIFAKTTIEALPQEPRNYVLISLPNLNATRNLADLSDNDPIRTAIMKTRDYLKIGYLPAMRITITSTIPIAAGLGSSAAVAIATIKAVSQFLGFALEKNEINDLAFQVEKIQHGQPSGIDNSTITYEQPLFFEKNKTMEFLDIKSPIKIIIADSGIRSLTKEAIAEVRELYQKEPNITGNIFNQIGDITRKAKTEIENGHLENIGNLMSQNHQLLAKLGVSCDTLDNLVDVAMRNGAYGAKLCGGGKGGNVIAVAPDIHINKIISALKMFGSLNVFLTTINVTCVKGKTC